MLLNRVNSPCDIKKFSQKDIATLAQEIRKTIIETVATNGGHLASNLGAVELTIALHRVFNSPHDAIIFDVSHQCYTHKLLTGRATQFSTLRKSGGISGFTKKCESEHDYFDNGHASNAISEALGLLCSWEIQNIKDRYAVVVIGDGALTGGMSFEGLANVGQCPYASNLIIIVNDNQMSIERNTGAISQYLSRLTMTVHYQKIRQFIDKAVIKVPFAGKVLSKLVFRIKRALKGLLLSNNLFSDLDFEYVGPLDGHDEKCMERILRRVKKMHRPVVVHVVTKKGKGYNPAESEPEKFHGVGPFCITDGKQEKYDILSFTESFSNALMELAQTNNRICCVTAAMAKGTGLAAFSHKYSARFFDVGIAESHAVTFGAALARGGLLPVVCIYSTFLQRAVDQLIEDVALQNLHVVLICDRAGSVPNDGETHQGLFDIALFKCVPNLIILSPATAADLKLCLTYATDECKSPVLIRYPKASTPTERDSFLSKVTSGHGVLIKAQDLCPSLVEDEIVTKVKRKKILFVTTGGVFSEVLTALRALLLKDITCDIYTLRFIKPIDEKYFIDLTKNYIGVVFVEDGVKFGGISKDLALLLTANGYNNFIIKAFDNKFYPQGSRNEILQNAGLSPMSLVAAVIQILKKH